MRCAAQSSRLRLAGGLALTLGLGLAAAEAHADETDDASRKLVELDQKIRAIAAAFREDPTTGGATPERRLVEAQTLLELKSYEAASTLLYDIVENHPNTLLAEDATVLLAEALRLNGDPVGSRRYFEKAVEKKSGSRREQQALQGLVELALRTGNFDNVDDYLERLADIPPARLEPSVPYVRGKYLFFRDRLDDAAGAFASIVPPNPYHLQAQYFLATVQVKRGDLAAAAVGFDNVLKLQPATDNDRDIHDLARLALGRIHYERSQFDKAKERYTSLDRRSKYFGDAMYESAWTSIKSGDFKSAYRAVDLLLLQDPNSPRAPELRLLTGNLNLRLANFFVASETFGKSRDEFEPIHRELVATLERARTEPDYFGKLIGRDIGKFDISLFVPAAAVKWVKDEPEVAQVVVLAADVGAVRQSLNDSEELLLRLDSALGGSGKVAIFPDLADDRTQSRAVLNQVVDIRARFAEKLRALAEPHLAPDEKAALAATADERKLLEGNLKDVPLTAEDLLARDKGAQGTLIELDGEASEINVLIQGLEAEVVALEQFSSRGGLDGKMPREEVDRQVTELKAMITELRRKNTSLRTEIADATRQQSAAGAAGESERSSAKRLAEIIKAEQEIYARARGRLGASEAGAFASYSEILNRADQVQTTVLSFDDRIDAIAEGRLGKIREQLVAERTNLTGVAEKLAALTNESQDVGGGLAETIVARVRDRFYDLTVKSDVGLIDVSWGLKDSKTQNLSKLITQQKLELKALDEDFRALLEEKP
jgi:tetratricopeptide (TPR) repeat protein